MRQVFIYPGEDGYWIAECPSLPGCVSQAETKQEAISNIREAIEGYILPFKRMICRFLMNTLRRCY